MHVYAESVDLNEIDVAEFFFGGCNLLIGKCRERILFERYFLEIHVFVFYWLRRGMSEIISRSMVMFPSSVVIPLV